MARQSWRRVGMHEELYRSGRAGWLRPAVLGANDGIVSTASLVIGVAAAAASRNAVLLAGVAGLVGGATSMAAGEYVSVSSQRDAERADSSRDRNVLATDPESELTEVYVRRGLDRELAATVAERLTAVDPSGSHVRDELGLPPGVLARPLQAAVVSALSFAVGAALPLTLIVLAPIGVRVPVTALAALALLALLGAIGARIGRVASELGQAARLRGAGRAALRVNHRRRLGDGPDSADRAAGGRDRTVSRTRSLPPKPTRQRGPRSRGAGHSSGYATNGCSVAKYLGGLYRRRRGWTQTTCRTPAAAAASGAGTRSCRDPGR
jgi:vacuolar iron transporter family protein